MNDVSVSLICITFLNAASKVSVMLFANPHKRNSMETNANGRKYRLSRVLMFVYI